MTSDKFCVLEIRRGLAFQNDAGNIFRKGNKYVAYSKHSNTRIHITYCVETTGMFVLNSFPTPCLAIVWWLGLVAFAILSLSAFLVNKIINLESMTSLIPLPGMHFTDE